MESLRNWQQELNSLLQHLSEINDGIVAATGEVESLLQQQEIDITSDVGSGTMSPVGSGVMSPRGSKPKLARSESQMSQVGEGRQFELIDGVPTVVKTAPRRTTMGGNEEPVKTASHLAFRLLGPWQERFAVCQEEATNKYNEFFCGWDRLRTQQRRLRLSSQDFRRWFLRYAATVRNVFGFWWSIASMILVFVDMSAVPFALAWPDTLKKRRWLRVYFEISPAFWILDLLFFIAGRPLRNRLRKELPFFLCKVLFDASLIVMDFVLVLDILPKEFLPFKLVRLLRTAKFRTALTTLENYAATRGSVNLFQWAGICEALVLVLLVNHFLACTMFYVGRLSKKHGLPNWLDETGVVNHRKGFQYLNSFNLVLAQYTPAPFQFQPQNVLEQVMVLIIICTCLPLLGSQIGRVSGTLNVLKERSTERERLKRDLHRWLSKTSVPVELVERILDALEDVLTSSESPLDLKDPAALTFLPSALTKELSVVKTGRQLHCHPFFNLLMDERLQVAGQLTGAFRSIIAVLGEEIFHRGKKAEGLYVSLTGRWKLDIPWNVMVEWPSQVQDTRVSLASMRGGNGFEVGEQKFMGELSLYTELKHSTTLSTLTFSKALVASADDFIKALVENPSVVVAVHEYATCLLQQQMSMPFDEVCWELPPQEDINVAVRSTQISELLLPQSGHFAMFNSHQKSNFDLLHEKVGSGDLEPHSLAQVVQKSLIELSEVGIYYEFGEESEALIAIRAVHCAIWILEDDYTQLVSVQRPDRRLSYSTWSSLRGLLDLKIMTWSDTLAVIVWLTIRGLPKCKQFQMLCPPIERHSRERMLQYAVSSLAAHLPSVALLEFDSLNTLGALAEMACQFNFTQFLQGENNPYSVLLLQEALRQEGEKVFQLFLLGEICALCSQQPGDSVDGSIFLDERNASMVIQALQCLQNVQDYEPAAVYWRYILRRGQALMYMIETPMEYVVARLLCLTRTLDQTGLEMIEDTWAQLSIRDQSALHEIFLADGFHQNAFVFSYLPMLLRKAAGNPKLGLKTGLQFLVEIYQKLIAHRCFTQASTVVVDLGSVALIMEEADDLRTLSKCLDYAQIIKATDRVVLHLTGISYQVLSGQLVEQSRHSVLLEHLAHQQGRVEALLRERELGSVNRQGSLTSLNSRTSRNSRSSRGSGDSVRGVPTMDMDYDPVIKSNF